eukprot:2099140-Pyramimonas_sp.AAC.1
MFEGRGFRGCSLVLGGFPASGCCLAAAPGLEHSVAATGKPSHDPKSRRPRLRGIGSRGVCIDPPSPSDRRQGVPMAHPVRGRAAALSGASGRSVR